MKLRTSVISAAALGLATATLGVPAPDSHPVIFIQNATILTVSHGTIERGSILVKD